MMANYFDRYWRAIPFLVLLLGVFYLSGINFASDGTIASWGEHGEIHLIVLKAT